jgi:L-lactate permease
MVWAQNCNPLGSAWLSTLVAAMATRWIGQEGTILRYVFLHNLMLAGLVGLVVMLLVPGG